MERKDVEGEQGRREKEKEGEGEEEEKERKEGGRKER